MIVAVDTGFLIHLAEADETAWDLYAAIRGSTQPWFLIATPAVVGALDHFVQEGDEELRFVARTAWDRLSETWQIKPVIPDEAQRKVSWILTYQFMRENIVPPNQRWEAELLGEASLLADLLVVSEDSPLALMDTRWLTLHCRFLGVRGPCVITPASLLKFLKH